MHYRYVNSEELGICLDEQSHPDNCEYMESAYCDGCGVNEVHYQDDYGQVALVLCAECNGGHATAGGHGGAVPTVQDEKDVTH